MNEETLHNLELSVASILDDTMLLMPNFRRESSLLMGVMRSLTMPTVQPQQPYPHMPNNHWQGQQYQQPTNNPQFQQQPHNAQFQQQSHPGQFAYRAPGAHRVDDIPLDMHKLLSRIRTNIVAAKSIIEISLDEIPYDNYKSVIDKLVERVDEIEKAMAPVGDVDGEEDCTVVKYPEFSNRVNVLAPIQLEELFSKHGPMQKPSPQVHALIVSLADWMTGTVRTHNRRYRLNDEDNFEEMNNKIIEYTGTEQAVYVQPHSTGQFILVFNVNTKHINDIYLTVNEPTGTFSMLPVTNIDLSMRTIFDGYIKLKPKVLDEDGIVMHTLETTVDESGEPTVKIVPMTQQQYLDINTLGKKTDLAPPARRYTQDGESASRQIFPNTLNLEGMRERIVEMRKGINIKTVPKKVLLPVLTKIGSANWNIPDTVLWLDEEEHALLTVGPAVYSMPCSRVRVVVVPGNDETVIFTYQSDTYVVYGIYHIDYCDPSDSYAIVSSEQPQEHLLYALTLGVTK